MFESTKLPTHPRTGLRAVGIVDGKLVWPILGGSGEGDGGDDGGAGGSGSGSGSGSGGGTATYTPPASQEELDRIVQDRLSRAQKQYGMTAEEAKAFKQRAEALEHDLSSETDKAVKKARDEAIAETRAKTSPQLVRQAFRAEAKGVLSKDQLDGLLEDYNPANYLTDDGDVDEEKVAARIAKLAGAGGNGNNGGRNRNLGQGTRPPAESKPGDKGRAEAEKRFGSKKS